MIPVCSDYSSLLCASPYVYGLGWPKTYCLCGAWPMMGHAASWVHST